MQISLICAITLVFQRAHTLTYTHIHTDRRLEKVIQIFSMKSQQASSIISIKYAGTTTNPV